MKNKKFIVKISAVLATAVLAFSGCQNSVPSTINVENSDAGITVTAENASEGSGGTGYITLTDGQSIAVNAELTENSSVTLSITSEEAEGEVLAEDTVTAEDTAEIALPAGEYIVNITAAEGATGSMTINAEKF